MSAVFIRRKVYNVTQLASTLIKGYDCVIVRRLEDVALGREKPAHNPETKTSTLKEDIERDAESETLFFVKSESDDKAKYFVDAGIPCCSCKSGKCGSQILIVESVWLNSDILGAGGHFCKHLAAIEFFFPEANILASPPRVVTYEDMFQLLQLVHGDEASSKAEFYQLPGHPKVLAETVLRCQSPENFHPVTIEENYVMNDSIFDSPLEKFRRCCVKFAGEDTEMALRQWDKAVTKLESGTKSKLFRLNL